MIKVAITGYSGFVAQNLEKTLKRYEFSVIGIPHEVLYNPVEIEKFYTLNKPDYTIHCAAYGNKFDQQSDGMMIDANINSLFLLLEQTKQFNYSGFINFSSSSVALPYETFYSATKAAGERIVRAFVNKYDKPIITVRPFTIIGKGEDPHHLIPTLIQSCLLNIPMDFVPEATHDFIGINDFCEAIAVLMQYTQTLKGQIIEIGTGICTTNHQVRKIVEKMTGHKANFKVVKSLRPYDTNNWVANPIILNYLKWKPKQTLKQVITEMIKG